MKTNKLLVLSVALGLATTIFGQTDITPAGLKFNTAAPITAADFFLKAPGGANPNASDPNMKSLMDQGNRSFFWGMGGPGEKNTPEQVAAGISIVDYGSGVGKVLRYDGTKYQGGIGWAAFAVYGDYRTTPNRVDVPDDRSATTRIRIVFNCDYPHEWIETKLSEKLIEFSIKSASATVLGTSAGRGFKVSDFTKSFYDEEEDVNIQVYDPCWYSAEWDIILPSAEGNPLGLFIGVPGAGIMEKIVYNIKEITFTAAPTDPRLIAANVPAIYEKVPTPTAIRSIATEQLAVAAEDGKVQVYGVAAGETIRITSLAGSTQKVVSTGEITTIVLSKGSYVIAAGDKVSKVIL